jgi:hypothetical protein
METVAPLVVFSRSLSETLSRSNGMCIFRLLLGVYADMAQISAVMLDKFESTVKRVESILTSASLYFVVERRTAAGIYLNFPSILNPQLSLTLKMGSSSTRPGVGWRLDGVIGTHVPGFGDGSLV